MFISANILQKNAWTGRNRTQLPGLAR